MAQERKNRRKGPDAVIRSINITAIVSWIIIAVVFILLFFIKPSAIRTTGIPGITGSGMKGLIVILLGAQVLISIAGIVANATRMKRKSDRFNLGLIISAAFAILGLVIYFLTM